MASRLFPRFRALPSTPPLFSHQLRSSQNFQLSSPSSSIAHIRSNTTQSHIRANTYNMSVQCVKTDKVATPVAPYSPATIANGLVFCSGQVPMDINAKLIEGSIAEMTRKCITNLQAVLEAAGSSIEKVTKTTIFVTDMKNFAEVNEEYGKHFKHRPARSCIGVASLPLGAVVEIECIALA